MAAITSPFTTTGTLALAKNSGDSSVVVELYGSHATLQFSFQTSIDGTNGWTNTAAVDLITGAVVSGTLSPADGASASSKWRVPCDGMSLRMNVTAIASGTATVNVKSGGGDGLLETVLNNPASTTIAPVRATTALAKTSNVTLADIPGLSVTLAAGKAYTFEAVLFVTATVNGGAKVGIGGTATATSTIIEGLLRNGATTGTVAQVTALGTVINATEVVTIVHIRGEIVVNAGGTFTIQGAQNASHVDTTTFKIGSYLNVQAVS